jgi:hypothetical protein
VHRELAGLVQRYVLWLVGLASCNIFDDYFPEGNVEQGDKLSLAHGTNLD